MLQKSLYLTRNILFIYLFFARCEVFFKDMLDIRGRGEGFPKFRQCCTKGGGGFENRCFCQTSFVDGS